MAIKRKYQGDAYTRQKTSESKKETYIGSEAEVDAYIATLPAISTLVTGKGYLTTISKNPGEGTFCEAEIEYTTEYDDSFNNTSGTVVGVKSAQLAVRNIQMPLEARVGYKTAWNYYLIGLGEASLPGWWETATDTLIAVADRKSYQWVKSTSEMPLEADENGKYWSVLAQPLKPGVEYWSKACFVVTESAKYNSASDAGSSLALTVNTIVSPTNTFGISGGNWKKEECGVQYDGKHWIATSVYTHSGDSLGWDEDLVD